MSFRIISKIEKKKKVQKITTNTIKAAGSMEEIIAAVVCLFVCFLLIPSNRKHPTKQNIELLER